MSKHFTVVDLFSGAGGMSYGFHVHPRFQMIGAADAEIGKPSMGTGSLQCNSTYEENMGFRPAQIDLSKIAPDDLRQALGIEKSQDLSVLAVCPPCTGFSRANPDNHVRDDPRNSLVAKSAEFAVALDADVVVMENARELIRGNFRDHFLNFSTILQRNGYNIVGRNYMLSRFGLPQIRERAIIIAAKKKYRLRSMDDLWRGKRVDERYNSVRTAFRAVTKDASGCEDFPSINDPVVRERMSAIPHDGGSWADLIGHPDAERLMTPAMKRIVERKRLGSHPDVYGRMSWDKPAPTIKRECAHIGNGRYAHPTENRLCSVREMAILQGFPNQFNFGGSSLSNQYRHIGDAVPPLVSYQLAYICDWILTGNSTVAEDAILPGTHLSKSAILEAGEIDLLQLA